MKEKQNLYPTFSDIEGQIHKCEYANNYLNISLLDKYCHSSQSDGFSIKYVEDGLERYYVNRSCFEIGPQSYLLFNGTHDVRVEIDSPKHVKGVCLTISNELVSEIIASLLQPGSLHPDAGVSSFFYTSNFLENQYSAAGNALGEELLSLSRVITHGGLALNEINNELFYTVAQKLVAEQVRVFRQLQYIPSIKSETRKELFRRVNKGKEFMDAAYISALSIEQIAREASMSEYHFFRLFKKVFGTSPHQYIIKKRLELATRLLQQGCPVSRTAFDCGFSDIFSFSKAFKKFYGVSPSSLIPGKTNY